MDKEVFMVQNGVPHDPNPRRDKDVQDGYDKHQRENRENREKEKREQESRTNCDRVDKDGFLNSGEKHGI
jgi:hypothetical protein